MHDAAGLQHIGAIRDRERHDGGLIDQQDGHALVAQRGEQIVKPFDQLRREAERGLVEHQHARARHQAARDREHLLLAAGQQPRALVAPRAQLREARRAICSARCATPASGRA